MSWLKEVIGTEKAIIAMCHMQPMPGDPYYCRDKGMDQKGTACIAGGRCGRGNVFE